MRKANSTVIAAAILILTVFFMPGIAHSDMADYCQVPPYVIQNVQPNLMIVMDTSGSMYNFAYTCKEATTIGDSDDSDGDGIPDEQHQPMYVDSVDGFEVGDKVALWDNTHGPGTDRWVGESSNMTIEAIDLVNNTITVDKPVRYYVGAKIVSLNCAYIHDKFDPLYGSYRPNKEYYGYFDPNKYYRYVTGRFEDVGPKDGVYSRNPAEDWDGNFLNWLTMRRVDVMRKALTGGKFVKGASLAYDRLKGEQADCDDRGIYRIVPNAENYAPNIYAGNRCFRVNSAGGTCNGSGSSANVPAFDVSEDLRCETGVFSGTNYSIDVRVPVPVEGVLQDVLENKVRVGLTVYNSDSEGGEVIVDVGAQSMSSVVNQINLSRPNANTPLAESLWTVAGYYAQKSSLGTVGPSYSNDFQVNPKSDPFNYGTGGVNRYPKCARSFVLMITDGEPCNDGNIPGMVDEYADGLSDFDCGTPNNAAGACPAAPAYSIPSSNLPTCSEGGNVTGLEDVALWAHTTDLRSGLAPLDNFVDGDQNLNIFTVYAFGKGSTLMKYTAINGGFEDIDGSGTPNAQIEWDKDSDGVPDNYFEAQEGNEIETAMRRAISGILERASSGTAASILASGEGSGANLIQAVFYPGRRFSNSILQWTGTLMNYWFYVDPRLVNSDIREDTDGDRVLHLGNDNVVQFYFDQVAEETRANLLSDGDSDGVVDPDSGVSVAIEELKYLWEAGKELFDRDITTNPRAIKTTLGGGLVNFNLANAPSIKHYLGVSDIDPPLGDGDEAERVIRFILGEEVVTNDNDPDNTAINHYRSRAAEIYDPSTGNLNPGVWKLGDVLNSTPQIAGPIATNHYNDESMYADSEYEEFINDPSYLARNMVFVGGNDGMLHAIKLGKLEQNWSGRNPSQKARMGLNPYDPDIGKEAWAFIPKNALPYLKYIPEEEYCHIYTVDLAPTLVDASINNTMACAGGYENCTKTKDSFRSVLIGGMRLGGACRGSCGASSECVQAPLEYPAGTPVGLSSYFALDVTNPEIPTLMWEFTNDNLGFTTTGPTFVRVGEKGKNGKWFAVFGSGPTGSIDRTEHQFMGNSDQTLRLFVVDLKTGTLERTISTGIANAFAGSMLDTNLDADLNYSDEAFYVSYVKPGGDGKWSNGGVLRVQTYENPDPATWTFQKVIDNIGPVTSSIAKLKEYVNNKLWLYFGTGRHYYELPDETDDAAGHRHLFGIMDPCYEGYETPFPAAGCSTATMGFGDTVFADSAGASTDGTVSWHIPLDPPGAVDGTSYNAERVITDPIAESNGIVYFTSYKPYDGECTMGGDSFIWAVVADTGGSAQDFLKGEAFIQVSTGAIKKVELSSAFTERGGRRTSKIIGKPPTGKGFSLITGKKAKPRVIHVVEE